MKKFQVGDKVICIKEHNNWHDFRVNFGEIYTIREIRHGTCSNESFISITEKYFGWNPDRFIKVTKKNIVKVIAFKLTGNVEYLK